jgi:hypothetical protein
MPEQTEITPEPTEISVRVRLRGAEALPAAFIASSIAIVENEVFQSEYDEVDIIFGEIGDLPAVIRDACHHRIRQYEGNSLLFQDAAKGSLLLLGVGSALAYWIVENTVGESLKDAYKESGLHSRLKSLFLSRLGGRGKELSQRLNNRLFQPISDPKVIAQVNYASNGHVTVDVDLRINRLEKIPPTPSQWMRDDDEA